VEHILSVPWINSKKNLFSTEKKILLFLGPTGKSSSIEEF